MPLSDIPKNYRETSFHFGGKEILVAGLARPDYNPNINSVMKYLKEQGIHSIFGLDAEPRFIIAANKQGLDYLDVTIPDFTAPDISLYDQVYDKVKEEADSGKKIAIHCMGGNGRTGTVLVALKLKELAADPSFYDSEFLSNKTVKLPYSPNPAECSENIQQAISIIRAVPGNSHAVEVQEQVESLMLYEQSLRDAFALKSRATKAPVKDTEEVLREEPKEIKESALKDKIETSESALKDKHVIKSKILTELRSQLKQTTSQEELDAVVKKFKASDEYRVLKSNKGTRASFFKPDSSIKVFEEIVNEQREALSNPDAPKV